MQETRSTVSMRHLHLYAHLLIADAQRSGKSVEIQWDDISTASIGPNPKQEGGLLMTLPRMASVGTDQDALLLKALISHEIVCHGHHTDFSVVPGPGIAGSLSNILEDPRGELLGAIKYPGSKKVIREGIEELVERGKFAGPTAETTHPAEILTSWLVTELRSELLQQNCLAEFAAAYRKLAIEQFGTKLTGQVKAIALDGTSAATTQGCDDAARRIVELLKMAKEDAENSDAGDQGNGSQAAGEGAVPPRQEQAGAEGQPGSPLSLAAQSGESVPGSPAGTAAGGQRDSGSVPDGFEPAPGALAKAIGDLLASDEGDLNDYAKGLEQVLCESNDAMQKAASSPQSSFTAELPEYASPKIVLGVEQRSRLRAGARAVAAALALKIEDLLSAMAAVRRRKSTSGSLRANRLWRVPLGDTQVFHTRTRREKLDTCVYLLADESGSMDIEFDSEFSPQLHRDAAALQKPEAKDPNKPAPKFPVKRKDAAGRVVVAAGEVLNAAEIPFALATFNSRVREWQAFGDDWARTLTRYIPGSDSDTNTHLAVVWALRRLVGRPEARKVLVVVLDGAPGDIRVLEAALHEARSAGIEVRFVLIGEAEKHHYVGISAAYGVARNVRELAQAVFSALEAAVA